MKKTIELTQINFSRAVKSLTKQCKEKHVALANNQIADMLAKSFGFQSYHQAEKSYFQQNIPAFKNENSYHICVLNYKLGINSFSCHKIKNIFGFIGFDTKELNIFKMLECTSNYYNLILNSESAKMKFEELLDELNEGDLGFDCVCFTLGELINELYEDNPKFEKRFLEIDGMKKLETIIKLEIENNGNIQIYNSELYHVLASYDIKEVSEEEFNMMLNNELIEETIKKSKPL